MEGASSRSWNRRSATSELSPQVNPHFLCLAVVGDDFLLWQRDLSVGSLANWEANYGSVALLAAATTVEPEPTTLAMALAFAGLLLRLNRRALV